MAKYRIKDRKQKKSYNFDFDPDKCARCITPDMLEWDDVVATYQHVVPLDMVSIKMFGVPGVLGLCKATSACIGKLVSLQLEPLKFLAGDRENMFICTGHRPYPVYCPGVLHDFDVSVMEL